MCLERADVARAGARGQPPSQASRKLILKLTSVEQIAMLNSIHAETGIPAALDKLIPIMHSPCNKRDEGSPLPMFTPHAKEDTTWSTSALRANVLSTRPDHWKDPRRTFLDGR